MTSTEGATTRPTGAWGRRALWAAPFTVACMALLGGLSWVTDHFLDLGLNSTDYAVAIGAAGIAVFISLTFLRGQTMQGESAGGDMDPPENGER